MDLVEDVTPGLSGHSGEPPVTLATFSVLRRDSEVWSCWVFSISTHIFVGEHCLKYTLKILLIHTLLWLVKTQHALLARLPQTLDSGSQGKEARTCVAGGTPGHRGTRNRRAGRARGRGRGSLPSQGGLPPLRVTNTLDCFISNLCSVISPAVDCLTALCPWSFSAHLPDYIFKNSPAKIHM